MRKAEDIIREIEQDEEIAKDLEKCVGICEEYFLSRLDGSFPELKVEASMDSKQGHYAYDIRRKKGFFEKFGALEVRIESEITGKLTLRCYNRELGGLIYNCVAKIEGASLPKPEPEKTTQINPQPRIKFIGVLFYEPSQRPKD